MVFVALLGFSIAAFIGIHLLGDHTQEADYLNYRLALNLSRGSGYSLNPGGTDLVKLSPGLPTLLSLFTLNMETASRWISVLAYGISALWVYQLASKQHSKTPRYTILVTTLFWLMAWPLWNGFKSEYAMSFLLIITSMSLLERENWKPARLLQGVATLFSITALIPLLIFTVLQGKTRSIWRILPYQLLPIVIWGLIAWIQYDHITILDMRTTWVWQDWLWIILFGLSCIGLAFYEPSGPNLWILITWAATDFVAHAIWFGDLPRLQNPAIAIPIAMLIIHIHQSLSQTALKVISLAFFSGIIVFSCLPRPPQFIDNDLARAGQINATFDGSIAHFRSLAFAYDWPSSVYRLDDIDNQPDLTSMLVRLSPEFIYLTTSDQQRLPVDTLNQYERFSDSDLWHRSFTPDAFPKIDPVTISYSVETAIIGYALDKSRVAPDDVTRLRLDWHLQRRPALEIGIQITARDFEGKIVASDQRTLPPTAWNNLTRSTYHALAIHESAASGLATITVRVDYRAGILGQHDLGSLFIAQPAMTVDNPTPIATLGSISLVEQYLAIEGQLLQIETGWITQQQLEQDDLIFAHLVPIQSNDQPVAQADGPPAQGRFPTSFWEIHEIIEDHRAIDLTNAPPDTYEVRVGWYSTDGSRLRSTEGEDYFVLAEVEKTAAGTIDLSTTVTKSRH